MPISIQNDQNALIIGTTANQTIIMRGGPVIETGSGEQLLNVWDTLVLQNEGSNVAYISVITSTDGSLTAPVAQVGGAATAVGQRSFVLEPGAIMQFAVNKFYAYISMICDTALLTNVRCSRMGGYE